MNALDTSELEQAYDLLARSIDEVGPQQELLFLGKLALTLADRLGDLQALTEAIQVARQDLESNKNEE